MDFSKVPPDKLIVLATRFFARGPVAMIRARPVEDLVAPVRETVVDGVVLRYHPTQLPLAKWAVQDPKAVEQGVENFGFEDFEVRQISEEFDIQRMDLEPSPLFPHFGKVLDTEDVIKKIQQEAPVDGEEIVEWMHDATAANVVLTARMVEYNKHSQVETRSGDANIPGVRTRSMAFVRTSGYTYSRRGRATVVSPAGRITVRRDELRPVIGKDFLGWAYAGAPYGIQWHGALGEFIRLANRITRSVGFPSFRGRVAPFFVLQQPGRKTKRARVRFVVSSSRRQRVKITFRDPNNYTRVVDEGYVEIPAGRSTVEFVVASYPSVPPVVDQMQPSNYTRTVLHSFEVRT